MQRTYRINDKTECTIRFSGWVWQAEVIADVRIMCDRGHEHPFHVETLVNIDGDVLDDVSLLNAFEWAIRDREDAARTLTALIVDDYMQAQYQDPCEVG